jgi:hypothetical protein
MPTSVSPVALELGADQESTSLSCTESTKSTSIKTTLKGFFSDEWDDIFGEPTFCVHTFFFFSQNTFFLIKKSHCNHLGENNNVKCDISQHGLGFCLDRISSGGRQVFVPLVRGWKTLGTLVEELLCLASRPFKWPIYPYL